ncbi:FHA domain-containing protein [Amphibiibacter pelophylacis]|uniref:Adenylate/guanylate cyclase domain-containing protein n=1 Tax=Amphibiibacter pelophylacis TaxID=1799477 RepID=A0ACC6NZR4_9BURK
MTAAPVIARRTVLFADLRGSTSLFRTLGNSAATEVVMRAMSVLVPRVEAEGGTVIKTLGDGLLAVFATAVQGADAALRMHQALGDLYRQIHALGDALQAVRLNLQITLVTGEVVEVGGDCYGDAVNVGARLLDHAGDDETLINHDTLVALPQALQRRFRPLEWLHLRGRADPVQVYVLGRRSADALLTQYGTSLGTVGQHSEVLRLVVAGQERVFASDDLPIILGRSPQAQARLDYARASRVHARVDWHGGDFQLFDCSFNGTWVRLGDAGEVVYLRRGTCRLYGSGVLGLGSHPAHDPAACVLFEVVSLAETQFAPLYDGAS